MMLLKIITGHHNDGGFLHGFAQNVAVPAFQGDNRGGQAFPGKPFKDLMGAFSISFQPLNGMDQLGNIVFDHRIGKG